MYNSSHTNKSLAIHPIIWELFTRGNSIKCNSRSALSGYLLVPVVYCYE